MDINEYFKELEDKVHVAYSIAEEARRKGLDPKSVVEVPLATSLAGRVAGLISTVYPQLNNPVLINRILELEKQWGNLDPGICLQIAEEIAKEKFCKFSSHMEAMDAGIRVGIAYITLGVVSSPIEGYTGIKLKKTKEGKDCFAVYYSGPIRSAGGTGAAFSLVIIDHLREIFGYAKFDPDEKEIKRFVSELYDYHERITNLQYLPTEEEIAYLARYLPLQIDGEPSEDKEVSNYKDLPRVQTNFIRSGVCLTLGEGLAQKAPKILRYIKKLRERGFKLSDWDFLDGYVELHKKRESGTTKESPTYIQDLVAGRPVLGHPSASGAFRLRYGRARVTGYSSLAIHPATMHCLGGFIAIGTQLKIEMPTKGCAISCCDSIEPPIVKMKNGSVKRMSSPEEAKSCYKDIEEIIYLGDLLVPYGDFANRNHALAPEGYSEQAWFADVKKVAPIKLESIYDLDFDTCYTLSQEMKVPLHPKFSFYWSQISYEEFLALLDWISRAKSFEKIVLPWGRSERERFRRGKRALELLGVEHEVSLENVIIPEDGSKALLVSLGISLDILKENRAIEPEIVEYCKKIKEGGVLEIINLGSSVKIKDKAGTFIGSRMGRPEKAKLRKLVGSPNVLFPVGEEGGRLRSVNEAVSVGTIKSDFPLFKCEKCNKETIYFICEDCKSECKRIRYCPECSQKFDMEKCPEHLKGQSYQNRRIDSKHYFDAAIRHLESYNEEIPTLVKGVRGTSNANHVPENLAKGVLRALFKLCVNKDGTIRYDATELPITHFKPREVGASVEKLRTLGYTRDRDGFELERDDQILELFPHDILLPCCPDTLDEKADEVFMNITKFIDAELFKFYKLKPFYNVRTREDLIGHLVACIAPHNCACVAGRIVGFTKSQALVASPYMHAAMRRDCLGYDSYTAVEKNGNWEIEKIGKLIEEENPQERADNFGSLKKEPSNLSIWSNPGKQKIKEISKHEPRKMLKIKLEDGRSIEATESHKFYTKGKQEKKASELEIGDKLMVSYNREIEEKDVEELFLPEIFKGREDVMIRNIRAFLSKFEKLDKGENFYQRDSFPIKFVSSFLNKYGKNLRDLPADAKIAAKRDNVEIPIRVQLDEELLEIFGLYIAEGCSRSIKGEKGLNQVYIASMDGELREFIKKVFLSHFGLEPSEKKEDRVTFSSRIIYELFTGYFKMGSNAKEKRIPSLFLNLNKAKIAALLRGYYEGDGSVSLSDKRVCCDSVSEGLKYDLSFVLSRFGIFTKFYEYEKEPGPKVKGFYIKKGREIPKFKITKITIPSDFVEKFSVIGFLSDGKKKIFEEIRKQKHRGIKIDFDENYAYPEVVKIEKIEEKNSYCFNVESEHKFFANDILVHNCDGDEAAVMLMLDMLLNFSREFLPAHRGGTQDAPLVLNARIRAGEVDDMIFDVDVMREYPPELYDAAGRGEHPSKVKVEQIKNRVGKNEFSELGYTHETSDINAGVLCSNYKRLPNMQEKVFRQMELVGKIRAADTSDVARLVIERHFIRDIRGNLRKFSQQEFRCTNCNEKFRRPPLSGTCTKCSKGNIIFTISEGSIVKYLEPALNLARTFNVPPYVLQNLEITKRYIESIFGREKEKQEKIEKWF